MTERPSLGYRTAKRLIDIVGAALTLILIAPVLAVVALAIWVQEPSAPVLFRQRRTGMGGRTFSVLKFRTMVGNADELKEQLRDQSLVPWPDFRLENDPRVTPFGRFLRKTSIDELPQLFNVLVGDMSLVGPRPTSFAMQTYDVWQTGRLDFRPGLTGPWQVWGRNTMDFEERCRLEISFFREPSIWREFMLMFATVRSVLQREGVA
jgi:lipopolysaccharide/colanic/teichoic acid biosynthesis glycosyltransferase